MKQAGVSFCVCVSQQGEPREGGKGGENTNHQAPSTSFEKSKSKIKNGLPVVFSLIFFGRLCGVF
jgi:hypothetical protein